MEKTISSYTKQSINVINAVYSNGYRRFESSLLLKVAHMIPVSDLINLLVTILQDSHKSSSRLIN